MALTDEQKAELQASMTRTPIVPDQSISGRILGSLGRTLQNPIASHALLGPGVGTMVGPALGQAIAPDGAVQTTPTQSAPFNDQAGGFAPKTARAPEVAPLKPMYSPDVDIQAAPTLTLPQIGRGAGGFGGGGGGGDNGIGSALANYNAANDKRVALIGDQAATAGRLGAAQGDRIEAVADLNNAEADQKAEIAKRAEKVEADAQSGLNDFMNENQKMANDIAEAKVDRRRLFNNMTTGDKVMFGIAAALGGMMQGLQGAKTNSVLDYVERTVDNDVRDQMQAVENKKSSLASRQNMFGQLLQQTGDRRLAAMQLRNLQLEAIKQKFQAEADRAGVPEAIEKANLMVGEINQKQADLQSVLSAEVLNRKRAEAAAAAAARAAAEEKAYQRQMDLAKLGLERDKLAIEAGKVNGTTQKDIDGKVAELGKALAAPDMVKGRASLDNLLAQLEKTPKGEQLEGFRVTDKALKGMPFGEKLVSDQANLNEQNWNALLGVYSNIRTGSGGSDAEAAKILKEAEGAKTPAERANFIRKMQADFDRREQSYRAAAGPDASNQYDLNRAAINAQMPGSVQVKKGQK